MMLVAKEDFDIQWDSGSLYFGWEGVSGVDDVMAG